MADPVVKCDASAIAALQGLNIKIEENLGSDFQALDQKMNPVLAGIVAAAGGATAKMVVGDHIKFGLDFSKSSTK